MREDQSRTRVRAVFESVGWTVEDLVHDYGEDQLVRIFDSGEPTGLSFFVQVKSAGSLARYRMKSGDRISYPFAVKKLRQWSATSLPVVLALWDAERDELRWTALDRERFRKADPAETRRVQFPAGDVLDAAALPRIHNLVTEESRALDREREAAGTLMGLLSESLGGARIEYDPHGVVIQDLEDGGALVHFFGEMLPVVEALAHLTGLPPDEAVLAAIRARLDRAEKEFVA